MNKTKPLKKIFILSICILLMVTVVPRVKIIWELSQRKQELAVEQAHIKRINDNLKIQLKEAKKPQTVERIAREKLRMVKDGESYVVEVSPESAHF